VVAVDARQGSGRPPRTTVFSKTAGPVADDHGRDRRAEEDTVTDVLDAAADFVWRTGRLIDRHRFAHQFLGGDRAPVLAALAAYQNPDGGWTVNFPAWTEAAGLEWRAWVTVHNLGVLRSYGRLG
jgi:hypothetical protein